MAPHIRQWPVCRRRWAGLVRAWTGKPGSRDAILSLNRSGHWLLDSPQASARLRLVHAWPSPAWIALRFQTESPTQSGSPLELTIWRTSLPDDEWRALRMSVERQIAMQRPAPQKERP